MRKSVCGASIFGQKNSAADCETAYISYVTLCLELFRIEIGAVHVAWNVGVANATQSSCVVDRCSSILFLYVLSPLCSVCTVAPCGSAYTPRVHCTNFRARRSNPKSD